MAKNSKKKTESQIRAERVANANKARETMIANAIAEYEASKQVQTQRQSALNAEKIESQSQHKQESTQPVVTQVVQQPANAQNTASVNQFFVKRTLDSSKKAKTCGIVSFVINGIILLA